MSRKCACRCSGQADPARPARSLAGPQEALPFRRRTASAPTRHDGHRNASSLCRVAYGTQQEVFGTARQCSLFRQEEVVTEVDDQPPQAVRQHIHAKKGLTKFERRMAVSPSSGGRASQDASEKY
jgi:hypothetical protein